MHRHYKTKMFAHSLIKHLSEWSYFSNCRVDRGKGQGGHEGTEADLKTMQRNYTFFY